MPYSYYIYYRVDPKQSTEADRRIKKLLDMVKTSTGTSGRLMKKRGEPNLWMEVYENVADTAEFERKLADAANKIGAIEFLQSDTERHFECFEG